MLPVTVVYHFANGADISTVTQTAAHRGLQYISASNTLMTIVVTPLGGAGTTYGPTASTNGSCTVSFTASRGPTTLAFTLSNGVNTLARFSTTQIIQPIALSTLNFSANPIVDHVAASLASSTEPGGTAVDDRITLNAYDKDNNIIVGQASYVDANGTPLVLLLSTTSAQAGGGGSVSLRGPARISAANQAATYAHYDGNWLKSGTIVITPTSPLIASASTTLTTTPTAREFNVSNLSNGFLPNMPAESCSGLATFCVNGNELCAGPDGNMWFADYADWAVGKITSSGSATRWGTPPSLYYNTLGCVTGTDGNVYFTAYGNAHWYASNNTVVRITRNGTPTDLSTGITASGGPHGITVGPDGNMWFTEQIAKKNRAHDDQRTGNRV